MSTESKSSPTPNPNDPERVHSSPAGSEGAQLDSIAFGIARLVELAEARNDLVDPAAVQPAEAASTLSRSSEIRESPIYAPRQKVETTPVTELVKIFESTQERLIRVREWEEAYRSKTDKPNPYGTIDDATDLFMRIIMSPQGRDNLEKLPLSGVGIDIMTHKLNDGDVPSFQEIMCLKDLVEAKKLHEHTDAHPLMKDIIKKTNPEYWRLTAEQRAWFQRVSLAPDLKVDEKRRLSPPLSPPKPYSANRIKSFFDKNAPRHVVPQKPKFKPERERYLAPAEVARVYREFQNNPRLKQHPARRLVNPPPRAILAAAKQEANVRLAIDNELRSRTAE